MIIKSDDEVLLIINDTMKKVICNDILSDEFNEDIKFRIVSSVVDKYRACFFRLKEEWDPKLAQRGYESIPTDPDKYAELVFSQPDYKSRSERF